MPLVQLRQPLLALILPIATLALFGCGGAESSPEGSNAGSNGLGVGGNAIGGTTNMSRGGLGNGGTEGDPCKILGVNCPTGGRGSGGSASQGGATTGVCSDSDMNLSAPYKVAAIAVGTNGSFADACDATGNLTEYSCETLCEGGAFTSGNPISSAAIMMPPCTPQQTGRVLSTSVNCGGRCDAGRCFQWCPNQGDKVVASSVTGSTVAMRFAGYNLSCKVVFTQSGYDCLAPSIAGSQLTAVSLGNCTGTTTVFGTDLPNSAGGQACTYECTLGN